MFQFCSKLEIVRKVVSSCFFSIFSPFFRVLSQNESPAAAESRPAPLFSGRDLSLSLRRAGPGPGAGLFSAAAGSPSRAIAADVGWLGRWLC